MLPCRPFLTSDVISARAGSTSARTRVDTWVVACRTSSPIDCSPTDRTGSGASGIDGRTGGTSPPPELVGLATAVLLVRSGYGDRRPSFHESRGRAPTDAPNSGRQSWSDLQ